MVTPELLEYIRGEIAKGKNREEIHMALTSGGGWSEDDLSEAFRIVIPMPNVILPNPVARERQGEEKIGAYSPSLSLLEPSLLAQKSVSRFSLWQNLIFVAVGFIFIISWYFYRPQITNFWNRGVESSRELSVNSWNSLANNLGRFSMSSFKFPSFDFKLPSFSLSFLNNNQNSKKDTPAPVVNTVNNANNNIVKNCGISTAPTSDPATYENDLTLSCLGESAFNCENAIGLLKDDFFPTVFEITKSTQVQGSCNFKLSYPTDSTLSDVTGKKLAGQYVSCPINVVKAIDSTDPVAQKFISPDTTDLGKYGSDIYSFGTLGLFIENDLDRNKITALGCEGGYIDSVIASYNLTHPK